MDINKSISAANPEPSCALTGAATINEAIIKPVSPCFIFRNIMTSVSSRCPDYAHLKNILKKYFS
ncbi:hypothetical protein [Limnohabitans sp. Jir72]|uniref:hypothetical protein n=1 Tax=Limnohabitans sp. Jir72 TaxID=1977909 RepID=UPI0011B2485E|nr:hypothetical protein [Limnohabitans sp. Jir72]